MDSPDHAEQERADAERALLVANLARLAAGEAAAMEHVYRATSAKLNALLLRILQNDALAEEVLQEVYLTVWRRSVTFDPRRASPITWLVTIARNKAIDRLRAIRQETGRIARIEEIEAVDESPSAQDRLERLQEEVRLLGCLRELEAKQQAAIRAAFFGGQTYEALAQAMDVPLGTMKSWIRRGLIRLRACMDR